MNNSIIAWKTRAQLDDFMVKMFHGFSKPQSRFIRDMVYGIQATGDTILTDIARCVDSENRRRNVENRLSRDLQAEGLAQDLQDAVMVDAKRFVDRNALIIADPTDVCKPHAYKMEHLTLVRDASRSTKDNVVFDSHGRETQRKIDFGVMPVKLPWRDEELRLVDVEGRDKAEAALRRTARPAGLGRARVHRRGVASTHPPSRDALYTCQNRLHPCFTGTKS